jgi:hypothetical protein
LSGLILDRRRRTDGDQPALLATASGQLAMLRSWVSGTTSIPVQEFAQQLILFAPPR